MPARRFRPDLLALEAREVPALNLFYNGADLLLTGTPTAGAAAFLSVQNTGNSNFQVTDGALNLGTYHVTRDLTLRLNRFDTNVSVDLNGGTLGRNLSIDVGAGDTDPATAATVSLVTNAANARVNGDVTFRGGSGQERFVIVTVDEGETPMDIGGSVRVLAAPVFTPIEDTFVLGAGATVHGNVSTSRVTYTTISGTVDGDVTANTTDSPGGMGFEVTGTGVVHGDVTATGGATAASTATTLYYSYARMNGRTDGDLRYNITSGWALTSMRGKLGGDFRVTLPDFDIPLRSHGLSVSGTVGGDTTIRSAGRLGADLYGLFRGDVTVVATGLSASVTNDSEIAGDFRYTGSARTSSFIDLGAVVGGSALVDLGGSAGTTARFVMYDGDYGGVADVVSVKSRAGTTTVKIGYTEEYYFEDENGELTPYTYQTGGAIGGDLKLDLGNGANTFSFDGAAGSTLGGKLTYTGGSGVDSLTITGKNRFAATIKTGAGNDTLAFAPDATVGSLTVDFGTGTDTWTPPSVIAFPVKLKRLP